MRRLQWAIFGIAGICFTSVASAADMAFKDRPSPASVAGPNGWYAYIDGFYENVALPSTVLGVHNTDPTTRDRGPVNDFSTRLNGAGARGGIGYYVPYTPWRLELGGSYTEADGNQTQTGATTANGGVAAVFLNGAPSTKAYACTPGAGGLSCSVTGHLNTRYDSWQINGKVASDFQAGAIRVSQFVALFGGSSNNNQTLSQSFSQITIGGPLDNVATYTASTALTWVDFGGRIGLEATAPVTNLLSWSVGGWLGIVDRRASLKGSDSANSPGPASPGEWTGASAISTSATTTAFVADLESGFAIKPNPWLSLRAFGGIGFDNHLPRISASAYAGTVFAAAGTTPAAVSFLAETSYYAGGGAIAKF